MVTIPSKSAATGPVVLDNVKDGETVHQRCIIIKGHFDTDLDSGSVTVRAESTTGSTEFPAQTWPVQAGRFKILALLSPGPNRLVICSDDSSYTNTPIETELTLTYIPLLQSPPLHLAIMVAKDSPLFIDCPPAKHAGISSAHASLEAAIAKFRMTAYMWQALTAEDMRMKGLGRRSFRLEEEWGIDTTSSAFLHATHGDELFAGGAMRSTAKIHIIPTEKTVKEIQHMSVAQQNEHAGKKEHLHKWFTQAIKAYAVNNPSFGSSARPIVAGLILDTHYSPAKNMILGHAALGSHHRAGLSLGIMGSHLTYSWPRFLEEVTSCLLDTRNPGNTVGNDNNQCGTLWEACSIGQGAFLHEVGHAFGAPHSSGIMVRGYAVHWPRNFVPRTAWSSHEQAEGVEVKDGEDGEDATENDARWDLKDALEFRFLPHFWIPGDEALSLNATVKTAIPVVLVLPTDVEKPLGSSRLEISSPSGLIRIQWNGKADPSPSITNPISSISVTEEELEARFPRSQPLHLSVLGLNGKERIILNVWRLFSQKSFINIPGVDFVLNKRSVMAKRLEEGDENLQNKEFWNWATLLHRRKDDGTLSRAWKVDVRTGCVLDGAYVYYDDHTRVNCGPRYVKGAGLGKKVEHTFGGHASQAIDIPEGEDIVRVEVSREASNLHGIRIHLRNGQAGGRLSGGGHPPETLVLDASNSERIVGFFGRSYWGENFSGLIEFGIITAPRDAVLPDVVYDMPELQNIDGGVTEA